MKDKETIRKQMHEILDIILDGNGFERRCRDITGTLPTLFFDYSGHVNSFGVRLCVDGWQSGIYGDRTWDFHPEDVTEATIESIRSAVQAALMEKSETDVLRRDILRQEDKVKDEKDKLSGMKKTLRKKERKEKAAAATTA